MKIKFLLLFCIFPYHHIHILIIKYICHQYEAVQYIMLNVRAQFDVHKVSCNDTKFSATWNINSNMIKGTI